MTYTTIPRQWLAVLCVGVFVSACSSSNDTTPPQGDQDPGGDGLVDGVQTLTIDGTAGGFGAGADDPTNKWTYMNLDTAMVVELTDAQADQSADWHVAFKRVGVRVNGGSSGPGTVTAALIDAQTRLYDENGDPDVSEFTNATAESELAALQRTVDLNAITFVADSDVAAINGDGQDEQASWWLYNPSNNSVNASPNVWYVIRGASGESFAKVHVTDIQQIERQISVEMFIQNSGETMFSTTPVVWTASIGSAGGSLCYDFSQMVEVDCTAQSSSWDMQLEVTADGRGWNAWVNGGAVRGEGSDGAAFGPLTTESQAGFSSGAGIPTWFEDDTGGVFKSDSWYGYSLEGNNRIWPNYRVYGIDAGAAKYKLQILSYYDEAGTSGVITMRYSVIE